MEKSVYLLIIEILYAGILITPFFSYSKIINANAPPSFSLSMDVEDYVTVVAMSWGRSFLYM